MEIDEKLLKPYNPKETEERIYKLWEESGFFNPLNNPDWVNDKKTILILENLLPYLCLPLMQMAHCTLDTAW